jgi:hypothetical protein
MIPELGGRMSENDIERLGLTLNPNINLQTLNIDELAVEIPKLQMEHVQIIHIGKPQELTPRALTLIGRQPALPVITEETPFPYLPLKLDQTGGWISREALLLSWVNDTVWCDVINKFGITLHLPDRSRDIKPGIGFNLGELQLGAIMQFNDQNIEFSWAHWEGSQIAIARSADPNKLRSLQAMLAS